MTSSVTQGPTERHQLTLPDGGGGNDPSGILAFAAAMRSVAVEGATPRELEVAYLFVVRRHTQVRVAEVLHVSPKTVEAHWRNLGAKAECGGRELKERLLQAYGWQLGYAAAGRCAGGTDGA